LCYGFFSEVKGQSEWSKTHREAIKIHSNNDASAHDEPIRFWVANKEMAYIQNFGASKNFGIHNGVNLLVGGNVGIGYNTPQRKLAVNSARYFNGNVGIGYTVGSTFKHAP